MNFLPEAKTPERIFKIPLKLHARQMDIESSKSRYKIVRCGRKFGKTTYAMKKTLDWTGKPDSSVWFIAPTYRQGKLIVWKEFKRLIPQDALSKKPNETELIFNLRNGSEILIMGGDEPDSLRGPQPNGVIFEEAAMMKPEVWHEVMRPNLLVHKAPAIFISTPKGFNWFKDLEDVAKKSIANGDDEWAVFHFTVYDNPYIDHAEIEKARIDCMGNEAIWRQEYMAEYESSAGRVFCNFVDSERHVRPVPIPQGQVPTSRAIDFGMRDDTACLWGFVNGKRLHIYREHAERNLAASTQAAIILSKTTTGENVSQNIIGHDAMKQDSDMKGLTVHWHFSNAGVRPIRPSSRDKRASRDMLQQLFNEDRIVISPQCEKLRRQLLSYEWKDTLLEKTVDGNDDLVDALHHLVELHQFDLFMAGAREVKLTQEQMIAEVVKERNSYRPRFPVNRDSDFQIINVEGTAAGYV